MVIKGGGYGFLGDITVGVVGVEEFFARSSRSSLRVAVGKHGPTPGGPIEPHFLVLVFIPRWSDVQAVPDALTGENRLVEDCTLENGFLNALRNEF